MNPNNVYNYMFNKINAYDNLEKTYKKINYLNF
jgi:hypothetical protein